MELDFTQINIREVKDEVNNYLFHSPGFAVEHMQLSNQIIDRLGKLKINIDTN